MKSLNLIGFSKYIASNRSRFLEEFRAFVRQPSVSAQNRGIKEAANILNGMMRKSGIQSKLIPLKSGKPIVFGEVESKKSDRTLLIYGHYDVQPPEPLEEWKAEPFSAKKVGNKIIGRGAADSKGNVTSVVKAIESFLKTDGQPPVNVKVLIEGEEEIGSPSLPSFVSANRDLLKADAVVCYDGEAHESGLPEIDLGVKGDLYVELQCRTANVDLHSMWGPLIQNPAWRLAWALNTLKDSDGRILVDGWYDDVQKPTRAQKNLLRTIPFPEREIKSKFHVDSFIKGRHGKEALFPLLFEPTCTISGFLSGYTGSGSKTVLPSRAMAKVDFRLVYDQNPAYLLRKLRKHLKDHGFDDIRVKSHGALEPSRTPPTAPIAKAAVQAAKEVYRVRPVVYPNSPASGPDYVFTKRLGLNSVWTGCAPPMANAHAPNEFMTTDRFILGIQYIGHIMHDFGR